MSAVELDGGWLLVEFQMFSTENPMVIMVLQIWPWVSSMAHLSVFSSGDRSISTKEKSRMW